MECVNNIITRPHVNIYFISFCILIFTSDISGCCLQLGLFTSMAAAVGINPTLATPGACCQLGKT